MGLLGGLVHSELYTDTACRCYSKAGQEIRSVVAMVAPTPLLSPQWSWQPTVMWYQSENNQSALTRHLSTFILDCYWVAHLSMCVLSWRRVRAPPPARWASPPTGSWWMESVCWKRRIPAGQFLQVRLGRELSQVPSWGLGEKWQAVGGTSGKESSGASQPASLAWQQLSSLPSFERKLCDCWHEAIIICEHFFLPRVMLEKDTHKPCLRTVHSGITGISQSSFKNDVAI